MSGEDGQDVYDEPEIGAELPDTSESDDDEEKGAAIQQASESQSDKHEGSDGVEEDDTADHNVAWNSVKDSNPLPTIFSEDDEIDENLISWYSMATGKAIPRVASDEQHSI